MHIIGGSRRLNCTVFHIEEKPYSTLGSKHCTTLNIYTPHPDPTPTPYCSAAALTYSAINAVRAGLGTKGKGHRPANTLLVGLVVC